MDIRDILKHPLVYQTFQLTGGFFGARLKAMTAHLPIKPGERIVDIGCGAGFIVRHLPADITYLGFDTDEKYISYASAHFGDKGTFFCSAFDEHAAKQCAPVDIVMMNGVLHHLNDNEADRTLSAIKRALSPGGRLFTLDGCFVEGQPALARYLLKNDRGRHVRTRERYYSLLAQHFSSVEAHVDESLSWVPYTWIVMIGRIHT